MAARPTQCGTDDLELIFRRTARRTVETIPAGPAPAPSTAIARRSCWLPQ